MNFKRPEELLSEINLNPELTRKHLMVLNEMYQEFGLSQIPPPCHIDGNRSCSVFYPALNKPQNHQITISNKQGETNVLFYLIHETIHYLHYLSDPDEWINYLGKHQRESREILTELGVIEFSRREGLMCQISDLMK